MSYKAFLVLCFTLLVSCVSQTASKPETPQTAPELTTADVIQKGKDSTIAFISKSLQDDKTSYPSCSGFWINKDTLMTALHCAQGAAHLELVRKFPIKERDLAEELIPRVEDPTGIIMMYIVENEVVGLGREPKQTHTAKVIAIDLKHDMALLKAQSNMPIHQWLNIAEISPKVGDKVYVIGHPGTLYFTTMNGIVAAVRQTYPFDPDSDFNVEGPLLQIFSGIYKGNSGGPVISDKGEVVGVVSFIARSPNQGFVIAPPSMKKFVMDSYSKNLL